MEQRIDRLMDQKEAAQLLGMSEAWFEMNRFKRTGLPYVKIGRAIRYRESDIQKYISDHIVGTGI